MEIVGKPTILYLLLLRSRFLCRFKLDSYAFYVISLIPFKMSRSIDDKFFSHAILYHNKSYILDCQEISYCVMLQCKVVLESWPYRVVNIRWFYNLLHDCPPHSFPLKLFDDQSILYIPKNQSSMLTFDILILIYTSFIS